MKEALSMYQAGVSERRMVLRDMQRTIQYMTIHSDDDGNDNDTASRVESIRQRAMESTFQSRLEASAADLVHTALLLLLLLLLRACVLVNDLFFFLSLPFPPGAACDLGAKPLGRHCSAGRVCCSHR